MALPKLTLKVKALEFPPEDDRVGHFKTNKATLTLEVDGKPVGPLLAQQVEICLRADDNVPYVRLTLCVPNLEVEIDGARVELQQSKNPRGWTFDGFHHGQGLTSPPAEAPLTEEGRKLIDAMLKKPAPGPGPEKR